MKTTAEIVREVAYFHGVRVSAIMGKSKVRSVVVARWEAMWRVRTELHWTLVAVGRHFGRDHSVVWFACMAFDHLLYTVDGLAERMAS